MAYSDVLATVRRVANQYGFDGTAVEALLQPNKEHVFELKVGDQSYEGFRVQHDNRRGPYKGGLRFHPEVDINEVRTLATLMSFKTAAIGLPLGGGKGGVAVDPRTLTDEELEELSRQFVQKLHEHIGPDQDVPAPDVNTNAKIIDWMVDEYEQLSGDTSKASFTGKSIANGGSEGREAATGRGGVIVLHRMLEKLGWTRWPLTMAVQGFGNVGSFFALVAKQEHPNWRVVCATDSKGGVCDSGGLDVLALDTSKRSGKAIAEAGIGSPVDANAIISQDVDVLVLGALGDVITKENMHLVRAKIILELANGPLSEEARNYLSEKGVVVIPDILANAGGVVVSYLEWQQNKFGEHWYEDRVNRELEKYLSEACEAIWDMHKQLNSTLADAAMAVALQKLLGAPADGR